MEKARLWFKLDSLDADVARRRIEQFHSLRLGGDAQVAIPDGFFLVCYPITRVIFASHRVYDPNTWYSDYAYSNFDIWIADCVRGHSFQGLERSRHPSERSDWKHGWPYPKAKKPKPKKQKAQVEEMYKSTEEVRERWDFQGFIFGATTSTTEDTIEPMNERVRLFTVAAIFYPELPEGAVLAKEDVEYPTLVLAPKTVLARSREEAQSRVAANVKEGYIDRQDGHVRFVFSEYQ